MTRNDAFARAITPAFYDQLTESRAAGGRAGEPFVMRMSRHLRDNAATADWRAKSENHSRRNIQTGFRFYGPVPDGEDAHRCGEKLLKHPHDEWQCYELQPLRQP